MKGNEIIKNIVRAEMPDLEESRDIFKQQLGKASPPARRRWHMAAAVLAGFLLFATTVYAVGSLIFMERLDTGGSFEFVVMPPPENAVPPSRPRGYQLQLYFNRHNDTVLEHMHHWTHHPTHYIWLGSEAAHAVNQFLEGQLFTADGVPFYGLMTDKFADQRPYYAWQGGWARYRAYDRGQPLYDSMGREVGLVRIFTDTLREDMRVNQAFPISVSGVARYHLFYVPYEFAAEVVGRDFRLPTAGIDGFAPPVFVVPPLGLVTVTRDEYGREVIKLMRELQMAEAIFSGHQYHADFFIRVENARGEYKEPHVIYLEGGEIAPFEIIAGTSVYRVTAPGNARFEMSVTRYVWRHDGLVYMLMPPYDLPYGQIHEIIRSMVE